MDFKDFKERAELVIGNYAERDDLYDEIKRAYFCEMDPTDEANAEGALGDGVKITISPDIRNQLMGAIRLICAASPTFRVPNQDAASEIEKFAQSLWNAANRLSGSSLLYDIAESAVLFGEIHLAVISASEYEQDTKRKGKPNATQIRAKRAASMTPYMLQVFNPQTCYVDYDRLGLTMHVRKVTMRASEIKAAFKRGKEAVGDAKDNDTFTVYEGYDLDNHAAWLESDNDPMVWELHTLPFIPVKVMIADGSRTIFTEAKYQTQPLAYGAIKSGLHRRQTLALTAFYTKVFERFGPLYVYLANQPGKSLAIDKSQPFPYTTIEQGEALTALQTSVIDPSIATAIDTADRLVMESMLYKQAFGQPLSAGSAYSTHALLSQAGRLPLVTITKRIEETLSGVMEMCFEWLSYGSKAGKTSIVDGNSRRELRHQLIPEQLWIETILNVRLPQDTVQAAGVAMSLKKSGLPISDEWILSEMLQIEQPEQARKTVWNEQTQEMLRAMRLQKLIQEEQASEAAKQQALQQQQQGGQQMQPGQQPPMQPPGGPPQGMPTEQQQMGGAYPPGAEPQQPVQPMPPIMQGRERIQQR